MSSQACESNRKLALRFTVKSLNVFIIHCAHVTFLVPEIQQRAEKFGRTFREEYKKELKKRGSRERWD